VKDFGTGGRRRRAMNPRRGSNVGGGAKEAAKCDEEQQMKSEGSIGGLCGATGGATGVREWGGSLVGTAKKKTDGWIQLT
jgi:hypothetical protein